MQDKHWSDTAEAALATALRAPATANPEAGAAWVRLRAARGRWRGMARTVRRLPDGDVAQAARHAYLAVLADRHTPLNTLFFIRSLRRTLRASTADWGQAGYALTASGLHRHAARWMADWRERADVEGWMLLNLASSLRALGRHAQGVQVNRHALTLPPDHTRPKHVPWVALEDALTDGEEARGRAGRLHAETAARSEAPAQPFRYLHVLAGQVLAVRAAEGAAAQRAAYREAVKTLRRERKPVAPTFRQTNRATYRAERRARRRLAADGGTRGQRLALTLFSLPIAPWAQVLFLTIWIVLVAAGLLGMMLLVGWLAAP